MANRRSHRKRPRNGGRSPGKGSAEDVAVIRGDFADYLRARNYAPFTMEQCQRHLTRIVDWLREHPNQPALNELTRRMVPRLLAQVLPGRSSETRINYRKAVFHWLRFKGRYSEPVARPWAPWLGDYLQFLRTQQGVGQATLELNEASAKAFMEWQFDTSRANWSLVQPTDIWRFARRYVRGVQNS
jgi:site-specific recombinase XerC